MDPAGVRDRLADGGRLARLWPLLWVIFLPNLVVPLAALFQAHPAPLRLAMVLSGVALFVAIYLGAAWQNNLSRAVYPATAPPRSGWWYWGPIAVLVGLSVALILGDGPSWLSLLIFTSASAGGRLPLRQAIRAIAALMVLSAVLGWVSHDTVSDLGSAAFWTGIAGILTIIMNHLRSTNRALRAAREEIARLAVEAERLRFARDLHDLLGHDLARIALQSELAEALAPTALDQAIAAMREVGGVARRALQEVRAAVAGYRQPSLSSELRGAGEILAAAGIAYRCEGERTALPPTVEAMLAWAVREGVTNVVKHSRGQHCTVRLTRAGGDACVEVIDDGNGAAGEAMLPVPGAGSGSGLAGLRERAGALGGRCDAGPLPGGGFRLVVTVPVEKDSDTGQAGGDRPAAMVGTGARP